MRILLIFCPIFFSAFPREGVILCSHIWNHKKGLLGGGGGGELGLNKILLGEGLVNELMAFGVLTIILRKMRLRIMGLIYWIGINLLHFITLFYIFLFMGMSK